ncbi:MAG: cytochrome c biogenesis protein CcsA [Sulfurospirillum sp.]|nr:cytochrome c biogenesis protein CcsA [Sulfurospirillum sp.]
MGFLKILVSMKVVILFLFAFAIVSGVATFVENDFGTDASWSVIYTAKWFEFIQIVLVVALISNIYKYKLYKKDKLPAFIFHVGFVVILLGAGITRYFGYEGSMHIREGFEENRIVSSDVFISVLAQKDEKNYGKSYKKIVSSFGGNDFSFSLDVDGKDLHVSYKDFIPNAKYDVVDDPNGIPMISMMLSSKGNAINAILSDGDIKEHEDFIFTFNAKSPSIVKPSVNFYTKDGKIYVQSSQEIAWFRMMENTKGAYGSNEEVEFVRGQLYTIGETNFAPKYIGMNGMSKVVEDENPSPQINTAALIVNARFDGQTKEIALLGRGKGSAGLENKFELANQEFTMSWGSEVFALPFSLRLIDFQLDRYPGSKSPMSYASEVEVIDKANGVTMPFRIYMNHVLDYQGFRFFQSSYDQDEMGTILSVNKDPGKWPTYLGYFLLSLGLLLNLVNPKSRFRKLSSMIQRDMQKMKASLFVLLLASSATFITPAFALNPTETLNLLQSYDKAHAEKFGEILVQSADGRIKPIDTVSSDVLNKIYKKASYDGMSANQVLLGMMTYPFGWQIQPMIYVYHDEVRKILGFKDGQKYASFNDFFEEGGEFEYKLAKYAEEAGRKRPALRNKFDKEIIKVDERVNIAYMAYTGELFRMIPKIGDENFTWYSPKTAISRFPETESKYVRELLANYFDGVQKGIETGSWKLADAAVEKIKLYQEQNAQEIMPSSSRIQTEMFFNKAQIFEKLTPVYLLSGLFLLVFIFIKMLKPTLNLTKITKFIFAINILAFIAHTTGLALRWYIAQHAPWSDGYESMIYIAWAIALAGIFFSKQSIVSLALTSILAGVTLFVAHLSWMDPQITTLVPVLKSYWLNIHVSIITASYGFLGLCALLGFFTLILFIFKQKNVQSSRNAEIERNIVEATRINEMAMILGLSLITVGNFLGGVWANESWGRYWGWDPKETWALVSILIYAAVAHFRFVPALNGQFAFAVASVLAFSSIIMTYFGVNFYLSGMHSYAAGDPVPIPTFVYYTLAVVFAIIALAFPKRELSKKL